MSKKIVLLNGQLGGGGAERFTVILANSLYKDSEVQLYLLSAQPKKNEYPLDGRIDRRCIIKEVFIQDIISVRQFLRENDIDVAVGIGIYANLVLCAANFFIKTRIIISERNAPKQDALSIVSRLLRKMLYWRADFFVFQTKGAQAYYSKSIQKRSIVIHNPVLNNLPTKSDVCSKEIVAVGRLMPQKNYPLLLRAFSKISKKHPDYKLRIFGQGIVLPELQKLVLDLGIVNNVTFEGFCANVHESIKNSDIFVLSSDFEGMPNALLEAMAMGFPVISTDCPAGGPAELIKNEENGILVPVGDEEKLVKALEKMIDNVTLKEKVSNAAKEISVTHSVENIVKIWKSVLL